MYTLAMLLACAGSPDKPDVVVDTVPAVDDTDRPQPDTDIADTDVVDTDPVDTDPVDTVDTDVVDTVDTTDTLPIDTALGPDADQDLVPDATDVCPGLDDRVDLNGDLIADCSQTAAPNSQLTTDVVHWDAEAGDRHVRIAWDPGDASGWARSGAMEIINETQTFTRLESGVRSTCIPVPQTASLDLWFHYLVPAGQMRNLDLDISVISYFDANCGTAAGQSDVAIPQPQTVIGSWQEMTRGAPIYVNGLSATVRITLFKPPNTGPATFLLDDLLVLVHP